MLTNPCPAVATALLVAFAWPGPSTLAAQGPPLEVGDRVRVTAPAHGPDPITGTVEGLGEHLLTVRSDEGLGVLTIRRDSVTTLERSQGTRSRVGTGALIGLAAGAGFGYAVSACDYGPGCLDDMELIVAPVFGLLGAGIGAFIGSRNAKEIWEPVTWSHEFDQNPMPHGREPDLEHIRALTIDAVVWPRVVPPPSLR